MFKRICLASAFVCFLTLSSFAQGNPNSVVITTAEVNLTNNTLLITGVNFKNPVVLLGETQLGILSSNVQQILVSLPDAFTAPGTYLLTVSTGPSRMISLRWTSPLARSVQQDLKGRQVLRVQRDLRGRRDRKAHKDR
jgi:hypothetical protein